MCIGIIWRYDTTDSKKAGERFRALSNLALIGQFGLSLMMPLILCVLGCYLLVSHNIIGTWIFIPGFILGLGASFMTAYKFYLYVNGTEAKRKGKKLSRKGVYFNRHL